MKSIDRRDNTRKIPKREYPLWGVCVHTTGSGVPTKAVKQKKDPVDVAVEYYHNATRKLLDGTVVRWGGPAFVLGYDSLVQVAALDERTEHVGSFGPKGEDRRAQYMNGEWLKLCSPVAVAMWRKQWPKKQHPWQLFPHRHPNSDFCGVEMVPLLDGEKAFKPWLRFTEYQHKTLVELLKFIAATYKFPVAWSKTSRFVGHEDIGLIDRSQAGGGWDPGWLRPKPYFDFGWVRKELL